MRKWIGGLVGLALAIAGGLWLQTIRRVGDDRVAGGLHVQAQVVENSAAFPLLRSPRVLRVGYTVDGRSYEVEMADGGFGAASRFTGPKAHDQITVFVDRAAPSRAATPDGLVSEAYWTFVPLALWLLSAAALVTGFKRRRRAGGSNGVEPSPILSYSEAARRIPVVLRGYEIASVSVLAARVDRALSESTEVDGVLAEIEGRSLAIALRGYEREQLDNLFERAAAELRGQASQQF